MILVRKKETENGIFIVSCIVIFTIIYLRIILGLNIPVQVILVLLCIAAAIGNDTHMLTYMVCCIPLSIAFQYKYFLFACILIMVIRKKGKLKFTPVLISVLLMMIWELCHGFGSAFSISEYFRSFAELLVLVVVVSMKWEKINHKLLIRSLAMCVVGICAIILVYQIKKAGWNFSFLANSFRLGKANVELDNFGLSINPNKLGMICNLAISGLIVLYNRSEYNISDGILTGLLVLFGVMTASRTFVVCSVLILGLAMLTTEGSLKNKNNKIMLLCLLGGLLFLIMVYVSPKALDFIFERFQEKDITNGRTGIFAFYMGHIFASAKNLLFGVGLQNYTDKISLMYSKKITPCHNGYQELIVVWGIGGFFLFTVLVFALLYVAKRRGHRIQKVQFIPLILILVCTMAGQLISSETMLLSLVFAYLCLCLTSREKSEVSTE